MDFSLSMEQAMLRDSLQSWLAAHHDAAAWKRLTAAWPPGSEASWQGLAGLGLHGLLIPEDDGGIGMGPLDLHIVADTLGQFLVVDPYLSTAVLGADLVRRLANAEQKAALLPAIAGGELRLAVAHAEHAARFDPFGGRTRAVADGTGLRLTGGKIVVIDAPLADRLLVLASEDGAPVLALVARDAPGMSVNAYRLVDERSGADVGFDDTPAQRVGDAGESCRAAVGAAFDLATVYACAEAVGAMRTALRLTVEHVKTRRQFGTEIGNFQALRHRIAEMKGELSAAEAMSLGAAAALDEAPEVRMRMVSAAKVQCIQSARYVGRNAVQLQGGMGMSQESAVGQYFKRLLAFEPMFGDLGYHQARFGRLSDLRAA